MGIVILIAAIVMILVREFVFKGENPKVQKKFLIFSGLILIIIFALRNGKVNYGTDLNNYYRLFYEAIVSDSFSTFSEKTTYETGYLILNWCISRIIKWPQFIIVFQGVFCIGITFRFIYKHSNDPLVSVLAFMSFGVMQFYLTGFRQSIAISICLLALEMAEKRKVKWFMLLVFLATSMHQTAIIFLAVYLLIKIPITKITVLLEVAAVFALSQIVPSIINFGNDVFEKEYVGKFGGNSTGGIINIFIELGILVLMYWRFNMEGNKNILYGTQKASLKENKINYELMPVLLWGMGFYCMRYQALVLERISLYFTPTLCILLPQVMNEMFEERSKKLLRIIVISGMIFLTYWRLKSMSYLTVL